MLIKKTGLAILFCLAFHACKDRENITPVVVESFKKSLEDAVNNGEILNSWTKEAAHYVFKFEKETIEIPVTAISGITDKAEEWKTVLAFSDLSEVVVPR